MRVLGVDPGVTGALAMIDTDLAALVVCDMPSAVVLTGSAKRWQISENWLADKVRLYEPDCAWVERVHSMPRQGVASSFSFGVSYGLIRGILAAFEIPVTLVTPNEWKRYFRLGRDKKQSRLVAARLFPDQSQQFARVRDEGRAEAALLALFGAQQQKP